MYKVKETKQKYSVEIEVYNVDIDLDVDFSYNRRHFIFMDTLDLDIIKEYILDNDLIEIELDTPDWVPYNITDIDVEMVTYEVI